MREHHNIGYVCDNNSKILILGSFPSVKSREQEFFYAHPQNRFYKVLSAVLETKTPISIKEKKEFLLSNNIALWDVIASCEITGSSDSSIKNIVPNNINLILKKCDIKAVFTNGKSAFNLYNKHILPLTNFKPMYLPSTSPANAAFSLEKLVLSWEIIKEYL